MNPETTGFCATCGYHENAHGNIAVTDCADFKDEPRPKPGDLSNPPSDLDLNGMSVHRHDQTGRAREGDVAGAMLRTLVRRREKAAADLHYWLRKSSESMDLGARQLERGKRLYTTMSLNSIAGLPVLIEKLNAAAEAVEEAEMLVHMDARSDDPERAAYLLEHAAEALNLVDTYAIEANAVLADELDADMPKVEHPLVPTMRAEASDLRRRKANQEDRERMEREAASDAARAERLKKPLGSHEKQLLIRGLNYHGTNTFDITWRRASLQAKAAAKLVDRGFLHQDDERTFRLTIEGRKVAEKLKV